MSEMIERVARVIFATAVGDENWDNPFYAEERAGCSWSARAAIEAMRTPTLEMVEIGERFMALDDVLPFDVWAAMIDAALAPPVSQETPAPPAT